MIWINLTSFTIADSECAMIEMWGRWLQRDNDWITGICARWVIPQLMVYRYFLLNYRVQTEVFCPILRLKVCMWRFRISFDRIFVFTLVAEDLRIRYTEQSVFVCAAGCPLIPTDFLVAASGCGPITKCFLICTWTHHNFKVFITLGFFLRENTAELALIIFIVYSLGPFSQ